MMSFAGKIWRLLVGIKDGLVLLLLLCFFALVYIVLSSRPNPGEVHKGALLLDLDGSVVEEASTVNPLGALTGNALPAHQFVAHNLINAIDAAAGDKQITAIALDLSRFTGGGQVDLEEIGEALDRFRQTGKPIFAYSVAYTDDSILLASHANQVWIDPMGGAVIRGPGGYHMYYADALKRFGIKAHVFRVGKYKSAVEPYMDDKMSDAARQNATAYLDALWEEWQAHVKQARAQINIPETSTGLVKLLAANGGDPARAAIAAGVADKIGTRVQWGKHIASVVGKSDWDDSPGAFADTDYRAWLNAVRSRNSSGSDGKTIGVITVAGDISDGDAGPGEAGAQRITDLLDNALENDNLSALVVRVDSPGGTVTGAESIRRAIDRFKAKGIPVAVSMGNVAASGGYWVSTSGDRIFAEPETITGSIGVFVVIPTFEDLAKKLGITTDGVVTTPLSGQPALIHGLSPESAALMQAETDAVYQHFLGLVAKSRGITVQQANQLGQGRVWTGGAARQLGLIDQFGGLHAAIDWAGAKAGLKKGQWHVKYLTSKPSPLERFIGRVIGSQASAYVPADVAATIARQDQGMSARLLASAERMVSSSGTQAMCEECMPVDTPPPPRTHDLWFALARHYLAH